MRPSIHLTSATLAVAVAFAAGGCGSDHQSRLIQHEEPVDGEVDLGPNDFVACETSATCEDGALCTEDRCVEGWCVSATLPTEACCPTEEIFTESFDGDLDGIAFSSTNHAAGWHVVDGEGTSAPSALYFGDPETRTYHSGARVGGTVTLPTVELPVDRESILTLRLFADIDTAPSYDRFWIEADVLDGEAIAETVTVFDKGDLPPAAFADYALIDVDLTPMQGQRVVLSLRFDSVDDQSRGFEGVYVDDLQVLASCPLGAACDSDEACDDGDPCTANLCSEEGCVSATICTVGGPDDTSPCDGPGAPEDCCVVDADCDDGDPTTIAICDGATCEYTLNPDVCTADADCDDGERCTTDACVDGVCEHVGGAEPDCCVPGEAPIADFDNERLQGIYVTDNFETGVFWRTDKTRATTPEFALYCGDPVTQTYGFDRRVKSSATTRPLTIPKGGDTTLTFDLFKATRTATHYDVFQVFVLRDGALFPAWTSKSLTDSTTEGDWERVEVPLTQYAGREIQVRFVFDSVDAPTVAHEGVYLDTIALDTVCR